MRDYINIILSIAISISFIYLGENHSFALLLIPATIIIIQKIINDNIDWQKKKSLVYFLFRHIYFELKFNTNQEVRITLQKVTYDKKIIQKVRFSYPQNRLSKTKFNKDKGVAGLALRTKHDVFFSIQNTNFQIAIIERLGFTDEEARKFLIRKEYYCLPLFDENGKIDYIVSFDSNADNTFTQEIIQKIKSYNDLFTSIVYFRGYKVEVETSS